MDREKGIVISSRVRIARNIRGKLFPNRMNLEEANEVNEIMKQTIKQDPSFIYYKTDQLDKLERSVLVENRYISKDLLKRPEISSFFLNEKKDMTIMVNEEDQIRIQSIADGLDLETAWQRCSYIDDFLDSKIDYAFDEEFGYLTSCPTNTGTAIRASVMLHLPMLVANGFINSIINSVGRMGFTVRGMYGEGSKALGNLFQISNQTTIGETEEDTIKKLNSLAVQIIEREKKAREILIRTGKIEFEDKVFRSLGTLKSARIITTQESMEKLSDIRIGSDMGLLDISMDELNKLMIEVQPGSVQKLIGNEMSEYKRDIKRAELLRNSLN